MKRTISSFLLIGLGLFLVFCILLLSKSRRIEGLEDRQEIPPENLCPEGTTVSPDFTYCIDNVTNQKAVPQPPFCTGGYVGSDNKCLSKDPSSGCQGGDPSQCAYERSDMDGGNQFNTNTILIPPPVVEKTPIGTDKCPPPPPCPSCDRCPDSEYECKEIPTHTSTKKDNLPQPILTDFSKFGM